MKEQESEVIKVPTKITENNLFFQFGAKSFSVNNILSPSQITKLMQIILDICAYYLMTGTDNYQMIRNVIILFRTIVFKHV